MPEEKKAQKDQQVIKIGIGIVSAVLLLGLVLYASYRYSRTYRYDIILPAGSTYLGPNAPK